MSFEGANLRLVAGTKNLFGLDYLGLKLAKSASDIVDLTPGVAVADNAGTEFYARVAEPILTQGGYYFCQPENDSYPGAPDFGPNSASPMLLVSVGEPTKVAAYARKGIQNGNGGKPAYLGLYFDKAYKADASGQKTAVETGILSPYGDFLPTEPGTIVLETLPENPDNTGARGEALAYAIKLQLDVNHDRENGPQLLRA